MIHGWQRTNVHPAGSVSMWTVSYVRGLSTGFQLIGIREYGTDGCRLPASIKTPGFARIKIFFFVRSPRHSLASWRAVIPRLGLNSAMVCWLGVMKVHVDHPTRRSRCILHNCDKSTCCWLMYYRVVCRSPTTSPGPVLLENCAMSWCCWRCSMKMKNDDDEFAVLLTMMNLYCASIYIYPSITILRADSVSGTDIWWPSNETQSAWYSWRSLDGVCTAVLSVPIEIQICKIFTFHRRVVINFYLININFINLVH